MSARVQVPESAEVPSLTVDQLRLIGMIADGWPGTRIGRCLGVKPKALWKRVEVLRRRLGVSTNAQLVHRAHVLGLLTDIPAGRVVQPVPERRSESEARPVRCSGALSPKPGATADDARRIARRLEAGFKGARR